MIDANDANEIVEYISQSLDEAKLLEPAQQAGWFRQTLDSVAWLLKLKSEIGQCE